MIVGGRYNFSDILSKQGGSMYNSGNIPNMPNAGTEYIIVNYGGGNVRILRWFGGADGSFSLAYQLTSEEASAAVGGGNDNDAGGEEEGGDASPPEFTSTGPVYTPLDAFAIPQRNYTPFYPQSYMPSDPAYPTMGLLSEPAFGGIDLYQPFSTEYGENVMPENLLTYTPPAGLDILSGPTVVFGKV